ncbi:MAG: GPR endopeptidase [Firmicutes bacterium]|nr:GPR endopeptidase [Bacillota bacterium]MCL5038316.1 GPR endopeptidase [Bacillota bacterium]
MSKKGIFEQFFGTVAPQEYTDLALEAHEALRGRAGVEISGVRVTEDRRGEIAITWVEIFSEEGERLMGKTRGNYITLEAPSLRHRNRQLQEDLGQVLTQNLVQLLHLRPDSNVFVVGLGNWKATPDALGPRVVNGVLVTRHLKGHIPLDLSGGLRSVAALAPGVLGLTGIETSEIIRAVVDDVQPDLVIAIDALAARNIERIATSIQLADSGIHPGSGVGNERIGLTQKTLGVPVVAIGVPTVVHAITIATNTIDILLDKLRGQASLLQIIEEMEAPDKRGLINEILSPLVGDLVVTPKEIDVLIDDMSRLIAGSLNAALHPNIDQGEIFRYIN